MTRIVWTSQARNDLKSIKAFIGRDAPLTATAYVRRLKQHVDRLKLFPDSGWVVEELGNPNIKEIVFGTYRIIYRRAPAMVEIQRKQQLAGIAQEQADPFGSAWRIAPRLGCRICWLRSRST